MPLSSDMTYIDTNIASSPYPTHPMALNSRLHSSPFICPWCFSMHGSPSFRAAHFLCRGSCGATSLTLRRTGPSDCSHLGHLTRSPSVVPPRHQTVSFRLRRHAAATRLACNITGLSLLDLSILRMSTFHETNVDVAAALLIHCTPFPSTACRAGLLRDRLSDT